MTPQQRADILLAEHQANRERNMMDSMSYFDRAISPHLQAAREYAYRAARECSRLPARPAWETLAESEILEAEKSARILLAQIERAKAAYYERPVTRAAS